MVIRIQGVVVKNTIVHEREDALILTLCIFSH